MIGETDYTSGPSTLHPKAIYIIEGQLFQVERLDFEGRKAFVRSIDCDYYTDRDQLREGDADRYIRGEAERLRCRPRTEKCTSSRASSVSRRSSSTRTRTSDRESSIFLNSRCTRPAYWLTIPAGLMQALPCASDDRRDGVVGLAFALKQVAQLLLMCDGHDIGISIESGEKSSGPETIFVYDNYPGGIGFSAPLFEVHDELLEGTRRLIAECQCETGCPSCVGPVGNTGPLAKAVALRILDLWRGETRDPAAARDRHRRSIDRRGGRAVLISLADRIRGIVGAARRTGGRW